MILLLVTFPNNNNNHRSFSFFFLYVPHTLAVLCSSFLLPRSLSLSFSSLNVRERGIERGRQTDHKKKRRTDEQNRFLLSASLTLFLSFSLLPQLSLVLRHDERAKKNYIDDCRYDEQNDKRKCMAHTFSSKVTGVLKWQLYADRHLDSACSP